MPHSSLPFWFSALVNDIIKPQNLWVTVTFPHFANTVNPMAKSSCNVFLICTFLSISKLTTLFKVSNTSNLVRASSFACFHVHSLKTHQTKMSWTLILSYHCFVLFCLNWVVCGFLVPKPGMEPGPPAVKAQSPNWSAMEFLAYHCVMAVDGFCRIY